MIFSTIIFLISLVILVVIHELGHFLVAKRFGIKVLEFGFGIPPRVWGKKIGETLFSLNALPFGGFVRLLGEDSESPRDEGGKINSKHDFRVKPIWQRILVVIGGVVMNLVLAWIIFYAVIAYQNFNIIYPALEPGVFVAYLENDFPAQKAGINIGDRILKVNNHEIKNRENMEDVIEETRSFIGENKQNPVSISLQDLNGKTRELLITPKKVDESFKIGAAFSPVPFKQYKTQSEKLFSGITYSYDLTNLTFVGLGKTLGQVKSGDVQSASKSVAGPVGLAKTSNDILSSGPGAIPIYLWFTGVISLTLAIFNVLPIPAMDGGRLLFLLIEAVTKKKVKEDTERMVHSIGFVVLIALAILVTYSDISKLISR